MTTDRIAEIELSLTHRKTLDLDGAMAELRRRNDDAYYLLCALRAKDAEIERLRQELEQLHQMIDDAECIDMQEHENAD